MIAQRPTRTTAKALTGVALSLVLAAAVMAVPSPASADEDEAFDTRILRGILEGIGLQRDQKTINYQERPPLVIPPSKTLPPPERSDALIANNPAWPKDPDVLRAKEEKARARDSFTTADEAIRREQRPLSPEEMTPGAKPGAARRVARTTQQVGSSSDFGGRLTPSQLGYSGGLFGNMFGRTDDDTAKFTGEPPRTALTEPPPGYQTPSPDQPYGLSGRTTAPKAYDYKTQRGTDLEK